MSFIDMLGAARAAGAAGTTLTAVSERVAAEAAGGPGAAVPRHAVVEAAHDVSSMFTIPHTEFVGSAPRAGDSELVTALRAQARPDMRIDDSLVLDGRPRTARAPLPGERDYLKLSTPERVEIATGPGVLRRDGGDLSYDTGYYLIGDVGKQRPVAPEVSAEGVTFVRPGGMIARSEGTNDLYAMRRETFEDKYDTRPLPQDR